MTAIKNFIKKETVFIIALTAAIISALFVPPSEAYLTYINKSVLILLFCLMATVAGFKKAGVLDRLSQLMLQRTKNAKTLGMVLVLICFFFSMLITNDVALITFVPLTIGLFEYNEKKLIFIVVMETVAANLGSLVTPIGNPQNLFLFSEYKMDLLSFFSVTLPLGCLGILPVILIMLCSGRGTVSIAKGEDKIKIEKTRAIVYSVLFIICLLTVLNIISDLLCLLIVVAALLVTDRGLFAKVDYMLLLTFVCFFIFTGNIARISFISDFLSQIIKGREIVLSALISQVISNVPAAVMLSSFTNDGKSLLIGTNIGGLGTLVASLASLISYKLYCERKGVQKGRYLAVFSIINFALFGVLLLIMMLF